MGCLLEGDLGVWVLGKGLDLVVRFFHVISGEREGGGGGGNV